MKTKTYIANSNHQIRNISNYYANSGTYSINASNNIVGVQFTNDYTNYEQAGQYRSITFGSNVQLIPNRCCYKFINLQSVEFSGNKIVSIGSEAFYMCTQLQSINLAGQPLNSIDQSAFENCENLHNVVFPSDPIELKSKSFKNSSITSLDVTLKNSNSYSEIFANCAQLTTAIIRNLLHVKMFSSCIKLYDVSIEGNITYIPAQCFLNCSALASIKINNIKNISRIDDGAFNGCTSLDSFALEDTNVTSLGSQVFFGTKIKSIICPASITSPSQISPFFLSGSMVEKITFLGMTTDYMLSHANEFTSFGANADTLQLISSNGMPFKITSNGLAISAYTAYVVTVALSRTVPANVLKGMYKDSARFTALVNKAYANTPELILGNIALNDAQTEGSTAIGNVANLKSSLETAAASGADMLLFLFSDHGSSNSIALYNDDATGHTNFSYGDLFTYFQKFKYVFAMFCCCYPNSPAKKYVFTPGENNTKALFWCPCLSTQQSLMTDYIGHDFMTLLEDNFDNSLTWDQQWNKIDVDYMPGDKNYQIPKYMRHPVQYNYNDFPTNGYVFKVFKNN